MDWLFPSLTAPGRSGHGPTITFLIGVANLKSTNNSAISTEFFVIRKYWSLLVNTLSAFFLKCSLFHTNVFFELAPLNADTKSLFPAAASLTPISPVQGYSFAQRVTVCP